MFVAKQRTENETGEWVHRVRGVFPVSNSNSVNKQQQKLMIIIIIIILYTNGDCYVTKCIN